MLRGNSTLTTSSVTKETSNHTVDTTQVVNAYYKGSEINRIHGRAATELYEQLHTIKGGNLPADRVHQLLDEAIESAKRLTIHAWFHAQQQDEDAKNYATKAPKLPQSLRHLESRESSTKRDAFNPEFVESYYEASFQEDLLRKSANNSNSYSGRGRGRTRTWELQLQQQLPKQFSQQLYNSDRINQQPVVPRPSVLPLLHPQLSSPPQQLSPKNQQTTNYSVPSDGILPGRRLKQIIQQWKSITNHPWPISVIQHGYKIQFERPPISWRNAKKITTAEEQMHINSVVKKFLDGGMIEISPTQKRNFLSKFFTLQEKTKRRPILDCQKLNSFIQIEHFKMEGVPALRELIESVLSRKNKKTIKFNET
ncbi:hypothetical protein G6F62_010921 [Rhizopus arrhizus]|nr:hypothetical protein G6F62_010921 [Rhizopus arrhizus]